ncbi:transposase [Clostridium sp. DJ247]|uniref:transposase n=1 Tax=Clostridium sp. DJ247 TaxID=2726188 RepID=UPI001628EA2A|nr:transposase [Clostridium sp. DJ247]MBC2582277.1 transposase [Clostridium sp. DJ247]
MTKDNENNKRYSREEKDRLTARMLPPENCSPSELAQETGISKSTLATWKSKAIGRNTVRSNSTVSSKEKFLIVMETYTMSEIELSKYCREKGLYVEDIKKWRISCIGANDSERIDTKELKQELQEDKRKIKSLEKELSRKEKALAETAALLVLRKKLDAILGENEED